MGFGAVRLPLLATCACAGLLAAPPGPASGATSQKLVLRGLTSQHQRISVKVDSANHLLLQIVYSDRFRCPVIPRFPAGQRWDGTWNSSFGASFFGTVKIPPSGSFRVDLAGNPDHSFHLAATLTRKQIKGSFTERGRISALTGNPLQTAWCSTGRVTFTAKPR